VNEDGSYVVSPGYYFYKQVSRAGQPGMGVAHTISMDSEIPVIAFSSNGTKNANAFVVVNTNTQKKKPVVIQISGTKANQFKAFRTTEDEKEKYTEIGVFKSENGELFYEAPAGSVTTFFGEN